MGGGRHGHLIPVNPPWNIPPQRKGAGRGRGYAPHSAPGGFGLVLQRRSTIE